LGLDLLEIVMKTEEEFGVRLSHDEVPLHVGELLDATILAVRQQQPESGLTDDDIWRRLQRMIVIQLEVLPEQVVPGANFVTDLGCV
jgi:hypothetical protein